MIRWIAIFFALVPYVTHAANPSYEKEERQIPKRPSAPPPLNQLKAPDFPHCERYFSFKGKKIECDSNLGKDGERLRPIMHDVPSALEELDQYQENRDKVRLAAYGGTAGLLTMGLGIAISRPPFDPGSGEPRTGGYVLIGGLILAVNSLIYGLSVVKANENHLGKAVQYYNAAHPKSPIELHFSTHQVQFSTQVNF